MTEKIPQEISSWSRSKTEKFAKSMKAGQISVFNGRALVIGCANAGKTTLVKKIKGDKNLSTMSTREIEFDSNAFKMNSDESTFTGKYTHFLYSRFSFCEIQISGILNIRLVFVYFSVFLIGR